MARVDNHAPVTNQAAGNINIGRQINTTIKIATSLADNMFSYAARIKGADVRMKSIGDRIRSTSSILNEIRELFIELTGNEADMPSKMPRAAKRLYDEIQSCEATFNSMQERIFEVMKQVSPPSREPRQKREKVELSQETIALLESRISVVELEIHDHKLNLQIELSIFSMSMRDQKSNVEKRDTVADLMDELKDTRLKLKMFVIGQVSPASRDPFFKLSDISPPVSLAATTIFHSRYAGWTIRKGIIGGYDDGPSRSWRSPTMTSLTFSSEELFLQVVSQVAKNSKKGRTLQDVYDGLGSQNQRYAIDRLINQQNQLLQGWDPLLEWKLAGLQPRMRRLNCYVKETASILVILKTELKFYVDGEESHLHGPLRPPFAWSPRPVPVADSSKVSASSSSAKNSNRRPQSNASIRIQARPLLISQEDPPHPQPTSTHRSCRKGKGRAGDSDALHRGTGYYPGPQDTSTTVQEEDRLIDSLLADWDEVVNIWSTRRRPATSFRPPSPLPQSEPHRHDALIPTGSSGPSRRSVVQLPVGRTQRRGRMILLEAVIGISGGSRTGKLR